MRLICILTVVCQVAAAQTMQKSVPVFEVASVKRSAPDGGVQDINYLPGGRLRAVNWPLYWLIAEANSLNYKISAPDGWAAVDA